MSRNHEESETDETFELLDRARHGDAGAFDRLLGRHREGLRRVVARRLDRSLRGRLDPSDVVQEAQMEALKRLSDYLGRRPMPFRDWLFRTAVQRLFKLRRHALAARRDVGREQSLPASGAATGFRPRPRLGHGTTPSQQLAERERSARLSRLLKELSDADRTILELRAIEGLPYEEVGRRLEIEPAAARKRYGRALLRLRSLLLADGLKESGQ
jgi:RNA polymerase sigma-70 factor (ECF subfamily)